MTFCRVPHETDGHQPHCQVLEVMTLVASGLMNKQIANELSISEVTVKMHRGNLMRKLKVRSVALLVRMAKVLDSGI